LQYLIVYIVDDDRAVLDSTAFLLETLGYRCELFPDGEQFLAQAGELAPGCLITDLRMPQLTGFELIAELRDRSIDWPAFLMTSDNGPEMDARAKAHGFDFYLRKPVEIGALVAALDAGFAALEGTRSKSS